MIGDNIPFVKGYFGLLTSRFLYNSNVFARIVGQVDGFVTMPFFILVDLIAAFRNGSALCIRLAISLKPAVSNCACSD